MLPPPPTFHDLPTPLYIVRISCFRGNQSLQREYMDMHKHNAESIVLQCKLTMPSDSCKQATLKKCIASFTQ